MKNSNKYNMKIYLALLFILFLTPFISAEVMSLPPQDINSCFQIVQQHPNATSINITKISIPNENPNYTVIPMLTDNGINYYYDFCDTSTPGTYIVTTCGNGDGVITCMDYDIPVGQELTIAQSLLFGGILIILLLFLYGGVYGMSNALTSVWKITYICMTYLILFCLFFIAWLFCDSYLWATPILASIFWIFWQILAWSFLPFIIITSLVILNKEALDRFTKDLMGQGFTREEAHEMAKRQKR